MTEKISSTNMKLYIVMNFWDGMPESKKVVFVTKEKKNADKYIEDHLKLLSDICKINNLYGTNYDHPIGQFFSIIECYENNTVDWGKFLTRTDDNLHWFSYENVH